MSESKELNFTNICITQANSTLEGNTIYYQQTLPLEFSQLWLHQASFLNTIQNVSALSNNNKILVSINGGLQQTILIADQYINADGLLNLFVNAITALGWSGTGIINSQYKYVFTPSGSQTIRLFRFANKDQNRIYEQFGFVEDSPVFTTPQSVLTSTTNVNIQIANELLIRIREVDQFKSYQTSIQSFQPDFYIPITSSFAFLQTYQSQTNFQNRIKLPKNQTRSSNTLSISLYNTNLVPVQFNPNWRYALTFAVIAPEV